MERTKTTSILPNNIKTNQTILSKMEANEKTFINNYK
jgi:hypothetical protein